MSLPGRPKGTYRSAQHEGAPMNQPARRTAGSIGMTALALLAACGGAGDGGSRAATPAPAAALGHHEPGRGPEQAARRRADRLLAQMTLDEKLQLVRGWSICGLGFDAAVGAGRSGPGYIPGIPRLGIPDLDITDGGGGIGDCSSASAPFRPRANPQATALPAPVALAASWDRQLAYDYGALLGREARAHGFGMVLGGSIGLTRDPRLGRAFEYMGEDPLLSGLMAAPKIRGAQDQKVAMSLKHLAANQQETDRFTSNSVIDERTLRELYLRHFEIAVKQARPASVMCSYNKLNGDWACENDWLLNTVLKGEWGFQGWVQSDWGATHSTVKAANAGLDEEQFRPAFFGSALRDAVAAGTVPQARLDDMVRRKLTALIANGVLDHPPLTTRPVDFAAGEAFAQQAAARSMVLLKNDAALLPLAGGTLKVALIGKRADSAMLSGGGSSQVLSPGGPAHVYPTRPGQACPEQPGPGNWCEVWVRSSPLEALRAALPGATFAFADGSDRAAATQAAAAADVVIVMAHQFATEGADLPSLTLRDDQDALIDAVAGANPRTVVVLQSGNPVLMPWLPKVGAVVQAWYAGIRGAQALADVLTGVVNPSARLPVTFPARENETPTGGAPLGGGDAVYAEGLKVGYRWYDATGTVPLFAFGHGLSYTRFEYEAVKPNADGTRLVFRVRNAGSRAGVETAQVYAALPAAAEAPPRRLVAWQQLALGPGEQRTVSLELPREHLTVWKNGGWTLVPGSYRFDVGASSRDIRLSFAAQLR